MERRGQPARSLCVCEREAPRTARSGGECLADLAEKRQTREGCAASPLAAVSPSAAMNHFLRWLFFCVLMRLVITILFGVSFRHRRRLPRKGPGMIVANHNSHLDTIVMVAPPLSRTHSELADEFVRLGVPAQRATRGGRGLLGGRQELPHALVQHGDHRRHPRTRSLSTPMRSPRSDLAARTRSSAAAPQSSASRTGSPGAIPSTK